MIFNCGRLGQHNSTKKQLLITKETYFEIFAKIKQNLHNKNIKEDL